MIEISFTTDHEGAISKACAALVAKVYKEGLGLDGFEEAKSPHTFVYAIDTDIEGPVEDKVVSVEGIEVAEPTFTEQGLKGGTQKLLNVLEISDRGSVRLIESCRTATKPGYQGIFSLVVIGATLYVHDILDPAADYVLSSVDPRLCHGVEKKASLPFIQIEGEWDFGIIPQNYHKWYRGNPQPIAVLHDVRKCYKMITKIVLPTLPSHVKITFHNPSGK